MGFDTRKDSSSIRTGDLLRVVVVSVIVTLVRGVIMALVISVVVFFLGEGLEGEAEADGRHDGGEFSVLVHFHGIRLVWFHVVADDLIRRRLRH
jgi:hypothetical protein